MRLKDKVAIVTGGAMGMGRAFAMALAAEGARVVISDIAKDMGEEAAELLRSAGAHVLYVEHDVTSEESWAALMEKTREEFGRLDILVNNAGIAPGATVEDCTLKLWNKVLAVNLTGVFLGCKLAIPMMRQCGGGSIINISPIWGIAADQVVAAYCATKAGVRGLTKSAALHCATENTGIRVNSVHPGFVRTPMVEAGIGALPPEAAEIYNSRTVDRIPMGRIGEPEDITGAVLFLASDESKFMTGTELVVDGGTLCH